jgi:hypothetical protein
METAYVSWLWYERSHEVVKWRLLKVPKLPDSVALNEDQKLTSHYQYCDADGKCFTYEMICRGSI